MLLYYTVKLYRKIKKKEKNKNMLLYYIVKFWLFELIER